jgi:hypothetical protein
VSDDAKLHLARLVEALDDLIGSSGGVYGLHLNDDPAPWETLEAGGQFEPWLAALTEAREFIKRTKPQRQAVQDDDDGDDDWHDIWERDNFGG